MRGKIPVKTIAANGRKKYKSKEWVSWLFMDQQYKGLVNHKYCTNSNKEVAEYNEIENSAN